MADTEVTFIGTDEYASVYGQTEPTGTASDVENLWNNEIDNGNYQISIDTKGGLNINQTSSTSDALSEVKSSQPVQTELNYYGKDAVIVVDGRSYDDAIGRAYLDSAGSDCAVGIVSPDNAETAAHELGHIYGAEHTDFERFGLFSHTLMENGAQSCNGKDPDLVEEMTYSDCSIETIRGSSVF